jgi:hypothetical protein
LAGTGFGAGAAWDNIAVPRRDNAIIRLKNFFAISNLLHMNRKWESGNASILPFFNGCPIPDIAWLPPSDLRPLDEKSAPPDLVPIIHAINEHFPSLTATLSATNYLST